MRGALFLAQRSGAALAPAARVTPIFGRPFAVDKDLKKKIAETPDKKPAFETK